MNRRHIRLAGVALAMGTALALTACSGGTTDSGTAGETSAATTGAFEYTDARGETVALDSVPTTVVAQATVAAALYDAGFTVAGAYGELVPDADGAYSYQVGDLPVDEIEVIGSTYGEFDIEDFALLEPQLIVDYTFDGETLWYVPAEQAEQIYALAPGIALNGSPATTDEAIESFVELAGLLGADTESDELAADKAAYDAALATIAEVASASGLTVAVMSPGTDSLYVADPAFLPEFSTLTAQGLDVMTPVDPDGQVFKQVSWEQASDYSDADVILVDARGYDAVADDLMGVPTWASLPAVQAGQVYNWYAAAPYSYKQYAQIYQELADELANASKL
ncbi:ABC transporter substrate-binding protein [Herbiconiux moechotypicola]|uniref:ABC transporter substrate-binding protein n=1 Tax=Herbiconiux moechotypicola TaxID=637393 RepID=A0ABN3DF30_9MICO|nr:ABC transporter substrate-binding protein [Herbiconiux moechotypicola]MCS5729379.1 ABC transporter substrate-binding protein [Herbiconiux moechotypicola]